MRVSGWNAKVSRALLVFVAAWFVALRPADVGAQAAAANGITAGKKALVAKEYGRAKEEFKGYLRAHPDSVGAELGLADAELALHEYEAAELDYRRVVAAQPQLWIAHKNLVIVEAALGRWSEFERERAVLRGARERGAPGISARESDVIDGFEVHGKRWLVREYFEPVGRSETRYNFECFSPEGRVEEFISLEPTVAAKIALKPGDVRIGQDGQRAIAKDDFSLNWYTGNAHGTIRRYPKGEPSYERVRADVLRWLRRQPVR
jgi:tetratricopeptide (TPR) repeat protein